LGRCLALAVVVSNAAVADEWLEPASWADYFDEEQVHGTRVVVDRRQHQRLMYNHEWAATAD